MSIRCFRSTISASALQSQFDRGVGRGHGENYQPPITTENFDSLGHSGKYLCPLTQRYRHYLSDLEEGATLAALEDIEVTDARENYPLAIGLTEAICQGLGLKHPRSKGQGKPLIPFTADLLLTRKTEPRNVAVLCKPREALRNPQERKEICVQHVYWSLHAVPIVVVTDLELTKNIHETLCFLSPQARPDRTFLKQPDVGKLLQAARSADWSAPLLEVVRTIAAQIGIDSTRAMAICKHLMRCQALPCDYERRISDDTRNAVRWPTS